MMTNDDRDLKIKPADNPCPTCDILEFLNKTSLQGNSEKLK